MIASITLSVVTFSILVQSTTIGRFIRTNVSNEPIDAKSVEQRR